MNKKDYNYESFEDVCIRIAREQGVIINKEFAERFNNTADLIEWIKKEKKKENKAGK